MNTTLKKELLASLEFNGESESDIIQINLHEDYTLDTELEISEYSETAELPEFIAWTLQYIYLRYGINEGDGGYCIQSVPRNPCPDLFSL